LKTDSKEDTTMTNQAKMFVGLVMGVSLVELCLGVSHSHQPAWSQFLVLLAAAVVTSRLRVKLPGMTTTMSGNLPVILLAVLQLDLLGALLISLAGGLAQTLMSGGAKRNKPVQILFSACTLINATAAAHWAFHRFVGAGSVAHAVLLALSTAIYFMLNTTPVAGIIALTEKQNVLSLWHKVFLWSFPNYVIGAGLVAIASAVKTPAAWTSLVVMVTVLFGVYYSYKHWLRGADMAVPKVLAAAAGR
jgi:hypothetical protein